MKSPIDPSLLRSLGLFLILALAAVFFIQPWGQFPLNDDWLYTKNVVDTLAAGTFTARFAQYAWAIPHTVLGVLLTIGKSGELFATLRIIGIACGMLAAIYASWICSGALGKKNPGLILIGSLSTFFFVPYFQPTFSFMTDLPGFLLWLFSLSTLSLFLERRSWAYWGLALAANALAVAERQLAILIPFAMIPFQNPDFNFKNPRDSTVKLIRKSYPLILFVIPLFAIRAWWQSIGPIAFTYPSFHASDLLFLRVSRYLTYLGCTALPFFILPTNKFGNSDPKLRRTFIALLAVYAFGMYLLISKSGPHWMPYFHHLGFLPLMVGGESAEIGFPDWFCVAMTILGISGVWRILKGFTLLISDPERSQQTKVIVWASLAYLVFVCIRIEHFDRYTIPLIPLSLLCLMRSCDLEQITKTRKFISLLLLIPYAVFATTLTYDYFRFSEARWEATRRAKDLGIPSDKINGGHEYCSWMENKKDWTQPSQFEYIVSPVPLNDFIVLETVPYKAFWPTGSHSILLQKRAP